LTTPPASAPATPAVIDVAFEQGCPVAVNDVPMPLIELVEILGVIAGQHGVGRSEPEVSPLDAGRRVAEAPAAVVLDAAYRELVRRVVGGDVADQLRAKSEAYVDLMDDGRWFTPARESLDALTASLNQAGTGVVRMELLSGILTVTACDMRAVHPSGSRPEAPELVTHS
jgi:argininosuccinate synthase